jgi:hypothetical protein
MVRLRAAWAAVLVAGFAPLAAAEDPPLKATVTESVRKAMKSEDDAFVRLLLARTLLRVAPDDADAAKVLVGGLFERGLEADANRMVEELLPFAPPALVKALLAELKERDTDRRRHAAFLLTKLDPKTLP